MTDSEMQADYKQTPFYRISRLRMPFTYATVLLAILFVPGKLSPPGLILIPGLALILAGMLIRLWAAGHIVKRHKLSKGGPYAYTRNPLYLGSFIWGIGTFLLIQNWWLFLIFLVGFVVFFGSAIRSEEDYLSERYGEEFEQYKKAVPSLIPRLIPADSVGDSKFSWNDVLCNDEHKALAWSAAAIAAILLRAYLR